MIIEFVPFFHVSWLIFAMLQYYCSRCCSTYFLNVALHKFLMLQYIILYVAIFIF